MQKNAQKKPVQAIEMTTGSLWKNLFLFSVPLMFAQVLEVMFNMSDVAVVGKFSSYQAMGSVGSTSILVTLFTGFLIGLGSGINVRTAHELGAANQKKTEDTIHTAFVVSLIAGLLIGLLSLVFADGMLTLMNTKAELLDGAVLYMRIYALGMPAMALYNCGNGILSAGGDTKRPLVYLTIAGILNVILNLFFVIVCHMAAEGVAIASVISQYVSAFLILFHLMRRTDALRVSPSRLRIQKDAARSILLLGIPAGIQNGIFAIANIFVQVGINSFDAVMVSGNSAAANSDSIIYNVMAAFYTGCASFIGRNWGAGDKRRMMKSYQISLLYSFLAGAVLGGLLLLFGRPFLSLFASETAVIDAGMQRVRIMGFSYMVSAFMDCSIAASRGIGKSIAPMVMVILGSCIFRIVWIYTIFAHFHTISSLYLLYIFSWTITGIAETWYFLRCFKKIRV